MSSSAQTDRALATINWYKPSLSRPAAFQFLEEEKTKFEA